MIDYKSIQALKEVIELQSFELAANKLCITQSAVSQRIKSLEIKFGTPILVRVLPYKVTKLGQDLLSHLAKVEWLESSFLKEKQVTETNNLHISIAINQDSLDTWFIDVLETVKIPDLIRFNLKTFDQEMTHKLLQKGEVLSCISTLEKTFNGCCVEKLGEVEYLLVCSADFYNQYFKKVKNNHTAWVEALKQAPSLLFNQYDQLNFRFMDKFYNFQANMDNCHIIPSVKGFKQMCLQSKGYALLPKPDILNEIANNQLVILDYQHVWKMPLFWHYWDLPDNIYHKVITDLISASKQRLLEISNYPI
ncbi:ArgP/LysG family DNA-binding transcriptional regulator [Francisella sp. 19X1-34]|uniref:ArgP/LysG family DNA-binding transcriptional regulator n=1 Tax=Francisella sp. 19X1-34 TaxID=3087177 RepID=UPI002E2F20F5|nr:ArgP/LysG family DNA-binding transcriptional regulator [Francisella sp. 19X1-34]MED7788694.1 ArgP/LysG family DNA-binding transcriptional regulator [Francisella sp. 19X1-34]